MTCLTEQRNALHVREDETRASQSVLRYRNIISISSWGRPIHPPAWFAPTNARLTSAWRRQVKGRRNTWSAHSVPVKMSNGQIKGVHVQEPDISDKSRGLPVVRLSGGSDGGREDRVGTLCPCSLWKGLWAGKKTLKSDRRSGPADGVADFGQSNYWIRSGTGWRLRYRENWPPDTRTTTFANSEYCDLGAERFLRCPIS